MVHPGHQVSCMMPHIYFGWFMGWEVGGDEAVGGFMGWVDGGMGG